MIKTKMTKMILPLSLISVTLLLLSSNAALSEIAEVKGVIDVAAVSNAAAVTDSSGDANTGEGGHLCCHPCHQHVTDVSEFAISLLRILIVQKV